MDENGNQFVQCEPNTDKMVRDRGFEPLTPSVSRKCSTTELTAQPGGMPERQVEICWRGAVCASGK
jgi:hypothetical protein